MRAEELLYIIGFDAEKSYNAVVKRVKDNQVVFEVKNRRGAVFPAVYHVLGGNINPHQIFRRNEIVEVELKGVNRKNILSVVPLYLPTDLFIMENPVGSVVDGTIDQIRGENMRIYLRPNVFAFAKRCKHAHTGLSVKVKLSGYKAIKVICGFVI